MNGIPINIRDSGQIKAHIARKGAPAAGGWGIVKLLYELQLRFNNPTDTCLAYAYASCHLPLHKGGKILSAIAGSIRNVTKQTRPFKASPWGPVA